MTRGEPLSRRRALDAESRAWLEDLAATGAIREDAVARLHRLMLGMARTEAARRAGWNGVRGRELDDVAEQAAGDAVVSVLRRVPDFRGESRFTTWACAFAVREVSSKLSRHVWRRDGVHLDESAWERLPDALGAGPEAVAEARETLGALRHAVEHELTAHQQHVFVALVVDQVPLDVLAVELDSNRNAIYQTMFEARRRLRAYLVSRGHLGDDGDGERGRRG